METASTWDSYKITLSVVLDCIRPVTVFEWGSGKSTKIMSEYPTVMTLDTVEHNPKWVGRLKILSDKVNMIYEPRIDIYPLVDGRFDEYDLIFVDGLVRDKCLDTAKSRLSDSGAVILHDAEREEYQDSISKYRHIFRQDGGHTVVMTDSDLISGTLKMFLRGKFV